MTDSSCSASAINIFAGNSLNLGAAGYVGGTAPSTAVFAATVAINSADTVITITFGSLSSGMVGTVNSNPGVTYVPNTSMYDQFGNQVTGTYTDTSSKFF